MRLFGHNQFLGFLAKIKKYLNCQRDEDTFYSCWTAGFGKTQTPFLPLLLAQSHDSKIKRRFFNYYLKGFNYYSTHLFFSSNRTWFVDYCQFNFGAKEDFLCPLIVSICHCLSDIKKRFLWPQNQILNYSTFTLMRILLLAWSSCAFIGGIQLKDLKEVGHDI